MFFTMRCFPILNDAIFSRFKKKHRKNCECCHHHSVFKGHNAIVHIVVLNCQKCNQCLKCQVSGHQKLSSKSVIKNCHQQLSSTIVITNCHQYLKGHRSLGSLFNV